MSPPSIWVRLALILGIDVLSVAIGWAIMLGAAELFPPRTPGFANLDRLPGLLLLGLGAAGAASAAGTYALARHLRHPSPGGVAAMPGAWAVVALLLSAIGASSPSDEGAMATGLLGAALVATGLPVLIGARVRALGPRPAEGSSRPRR